MIALVFAGLLAIWAARPVVAADVRLLGFGDSLTAGYGLGQDEGLVPQLNAWLAARGAGVEVLQGGVSGDTTAGGLARLDWALSGDIGGIILELGGNDVLRGLPPGEARANLKAMLEIAQARGLEVLLVGVPVAGNYGEDYKARFEAIWPELAAEYRTLLYPDIMAPLGDDPAAALALMQGDGIHPNAEGVARIVADMGPFVLELAERVRAE